MATGTAIAVAAIWLFAGMAWTSRYVSSDGALIALVVAAGFTAYLI